MLRANTPMLHFARQLGFELRRDPDDHDTVRVPWRRMISSRSCGALDEPMRVFEKSLVDMASGQVLRVIATDQGSVCDMEAFAEQTGARPGEDGP